MKIQTSENSFLETLNFLKNKSQLLKTGAKFKLSTKYLISELEKREIFYICDPNGEHISILKNDGVHIARGTDFGINTNNTIQITKNKNLTNYILDAHGVKTPQEIILARKQENFEQLNEFVKKNGFPIVMKPNDLQRGVGVYIIKNISSLKKLFLDFGDDRNYPSAIFQTFVKGKEYRVLYLDGEILLVYEKVPFEIIGNGKKTILELIIEPLVKKPAMINLARKNLKTAGVDENKILKKGEKFQVFDVINDATQQTIKRNFEPGDEEFLKKIAESIGSKYFGADIITSGKIKDGSVIELNSRPAILWAMKDYPSFKKIFWKKLCDYILKN